MTTITPNQDIKLQGYVVKCDIETPSHVFGRGDLFSIEIEPVDPFFPEELYEAIFSEVGHVCSEQELKDIKDTISNRVTFTTIIKPLTTGDIHPGVEVLVSCRFELATTSDGEHYYLNPQLSFVDALVPAEDEINWDEVDGTYSF